MQETAPEDNGEPQESEETKNLRMEHERELRAWRENNMTQVIAGQLQEEQAKALRTLISAASVSSDANVARPANEYIALGKLLKNMRNPTDG